MLTKGKNAKGKNKPKGKKLEKKIGGPGHTRKKMEKKIGGPGKTRKKLLESLCFVCRAFQKSAKIQKHDFPGKKTQKVHNFPQKKQQQAQKKAQQKAQKKTQRLGLRSTTSQSKISQPRSGKKNQKTPI